MAPLTRLRTWWRRHHGDPARLVDCLTCGQRLPVDRAHIVVEVPDDDDEHAMKGGGTVMLAEYHPACCPGGCEQGHAALN